MSNSRYLEKIEFTPELDKALDNLMGYDLLPCTCQLFTRAFDGKIKSHGSGVLAFLGGSHYLLTAAHVTEGMTDEFPLFIRAQQGYLSIIGGLRETDLEKDSQIDLAYIRLDSKLVSLIESGYKFLPLSKIRKHSKLLYATQYCVFGFPQDSTKRIDGKLKSQAEGYFVEASKDKVYEHYKYSNDTCFILDFKGKGIDVRTGIKSKVTTQPNGLSGCGLWLIMPEFDGKDWIIDYRLVGIMTEFKNGKYFCLIGNRIELLVNGIQEFEGLKLTTKTIS